MHTKDRLAAALRELKLDIMAKRAERGYYHEFLSTPDFPEAALVNDLRHMANRRPYQRTEILEFRKRVMNGEFNATNEEGEMWTASREGQDAMRRSAEGPPTTPTSDEPSGNTISTIPRPPDDLSYRALAARISKARK